MIWEEAMNESEEKIRIILLGTKLKKIRSCSFSSRKKQIWSCVWAGVGFWGRIRRRERERESAQWQLWSISWYHCLCWMDNRRTQHGAIFTRASRTSPSISRFTRCVSSDVSKKRARSFIATIISFRCLILFPFLLSLHSLVLLGGCFLRNLSRMRWVVDWRDFLSSSPWLDITTVPNAWSPRWNIGFSAINRRRFDEGTIRTFCSFDPC
jgi:hypothetical protein